LYETAGNHVRTDTTSGTARTTGASSNGATDLFVDGTMNVGVSSSDDVVREYSSGKALVAVLGTGSLTDPAGVAFAGNHLYVADTGNDRIVRYSFSALETAWGEYPDPGVEDSPSGIAVDASNNVYATSQAEDRSQ